MNKCSDLLIMVDENFLLESFYEEKIYYLVCRCVFQPEVARHCFGRRTKADLSDRGRSAL
jgi:hypothetical protein